MKTTGWALDLFDTPPPAHHSSATSQAAADSLPNVGTLRWRVLQFVRMKGPRGVIRDDVVDELGLLTQTACARLNELERQGLIEVKRDDRGKPATCRPSATGRPAQVYVARPL